MADGGSPSCGFEAARGESQPPSGTSNAAAGCSPRGRREERSALYHNNGDGSFTDVTQAAGVAARVYGHGGCVGDVDGDGLPDIYLTAVGPNILYRNDGDGTFTDVTERARVGDAGPSIGATFFDADGDGDQDLFVANYLDATWEEILAARRTRRWQGKALVQIHLREGNAGDAQAAVERFRELKAREDEEFLRHNRAHFLRLEAAEAVAAGETARAIEIYTGIVADGVGEPADFLALAAAWLRLGDGVKAFAWYESVLEAAPYDREALEGLARAAERTGRNEVVERCRQRLELLAP